MDGSIKMLAETFLQLVDNTADDFEPIGLLTNVVRSLHRSPRRVGSGGCTRRYQRGATGSRRLERPGHPARHSSRSIRKVPASTQTRSIRPIFHNDLRLSHLAVRLQNQRALPLRSVHAFPMRARAQAVGTLNLFRTQPRSLWDTDLTVAQTFADAAAIALLQDRAISALHQLTVQLQGAWRAASSSNKQKARSPNMPASPWTRHTLDCSLTPATAKQN